MSDLLNGARQRLDAVDALRGFALAGIVIAHMIEQYIGAPRPSEGWSVEAVLADNIVLGGHMLLVMGKFYSIFALLFGMSFAIMMQNAAARGENFSGRFLWRLSLLGVIGIVHSLIYRGDILLVYVIIGFLLPLFYNVPNKWLWAIATLLFLGAGRFAFFILTGKATLLSWENSPESPVVANYVHTLKTGSFWDVVQVNFPYMYTGKFDFQFGIFGRGYYTLAYFLLGLWLVRSGITHNLAEHKPGIKRCLWWSLGLTFLLYLCTFAAFSQVKMPPDFATWPTVLAYNVFDLTNLSTTVFFICAFLLLYLRKPSGRLNALVPFGRMALSNYLLQSLLGTFIFYGWGLGLVGEIHDWQMLLFSLVFIYLQVQFSKYWLQHFHYGPLEWLWRSGTWFRFTRFRRAE